MSGSYGGEPVPSGTITPRQRACLQLAAAGLRNVEIGRRLGISEETVNNHMYQIGERLGTQGRTAAVVLAWRRGWIW